MFLKKEFLKAQEQTSPYAKRWARRKKTSLAEQRPSAGTQGKKQRVCDLWKKEQETQEGYEDVVRLCRGKIRRAKAQVELNVLTAIKYNRNVSINVLATKGGLRRISILHWMQVETQWHRMRKRLRYLIPSLLQSLIVRLVVFWVPGPMSWQTGTGRRMKAP